MTKLLAREEKKSHFCTPQSQGKREIEIRGIEEEGEGKGGSKFISKNIWRLRK